ncbi:MAG: hypothetical protein C0483_05765 [Pirellula sp.]|nr:hypothetical protein [Pirellula sp.]
MKADEAFDPVGVGLLGSLRKMPHTDGVAHLIEEFHAWLLVCLVRSKSALVGRSGVSSRDNQF